MSRVDWSDDALDDLTSIRLWISRDNPTAARALTEKLVRKSDILTEFPGAGRRGRSRGTREFVVHHNYVLIYREDDGFVTIPRVLHTARRWP